MKKTSVKRRGPNVEVVVIPDGNGHEEVQLRLEDTCLCFDAGRIHGEARKDMLQEAAKLRRLLHGFTKPVEGKSR